MHNILTNNRPVFLKEYCTYIIRSRCFKGLSWKTVWLTSSSITLRVNQSVAIVETPLDNGTASWISKWWSFLNCLQNFHKRPANIKLVIWPKTTFIQDFPNVIFPLADGRRKLEKSCALISHHKPIFPAFVPHIFLAPSGLYEFCFEYCAPAPIYLIRRIIH